MAHTIQQLAAEYHELNGSHIEVLDRPPSALEFSRLVHISRPVVIKGLKIPAYTAWSNEYLINKMGSDKISIAITPDGYADAITSGPDNKLYFAEPLVEKMTMIEFLSRISSETSSECSEIHYLQSQNGNLYSSDYFQGDRADAPSEFASLRSDVPSELAWCSDAFDKRPDAVNLWIGDSRSVTSIHSDPYENIYTVVRGAKHFTLLPPTEGWCLRERSYPHARYIRRFPSSPVALEPSATASTTDVRWSSVSDPHLPNALPSSAHPIHVTLKPGETLYLPVGWWHYVRQSDLTIALNWWYDVEMRGMTWVLLSFLRGLGDVPLGNPTHNTSESEEQHPYKENSLIPSSGHSRQSD